jgi:hypothetical protein
MKKRFAILRENKSKFNVVYCSVLLSRQRWFFVQLLQKHSKPKKQFP